MTDPRPAYRLCWNCRRPATMHVTMSTTTHAAQDYLPTLARLLMCSLFIWDGVLQLRDPAGTVQYFTSLNIPAPQIAVWVSIAVHLLGGIAILVGFMTRWPAAFSTCSRMVRVR